MSLLTIRDLTISHNKQNILNNINLKLNTAEIIGIAGGSGSDGGRLFLVCVRLLPGGGRGPGGPGKRRSSGGSG